MVEAVSLKVFKSSTNPNTIAHTYDTASTNRENIADNTLKGVLLNAHIKNGNNTQGNISDFNDISTSLLIPENYINNKVQKDRKKEELFDIKKAMKPLLIAGGVSLATILATSTIVKNYSKVMATDAGVVRPPDLARNINILEEPHFAFYQALRDPSKNKILGFIGVGIMSVITIGAKNFVEGIKEIWVKKQNCDIEHDLQENLINVETEVFAGKLEVVNTLLKDTTNYFKSALGDKETKNTNFKSFLSFKGDNKDKTDENKSSLRKNILTIAGVIAGAVAVGVLLYKNTAKTKDNLQDFMKKFSDKEIRANIESAINLAKESEDKTLGKEAAIEKLSDIFKLTNAPEKDIKAKLGEIEGITQDEIEETVKKIKKAQIYAKAPEALGGVSEKIQYYCYINEERGHLYNWILNPENKFNKYIFLGFCAITSTGYILKTIANAIKDVTVGKENAKSELNLRKNLIATEIDNFKAKKLSAINPLIENFDYQMKNGKSKQELKTLAENILLEIKNGPPYVYS